MTGSYTQDLTSSTLRCLSRAAARRVCTPDLIEYRWTVSVDTVAISMRRPGWGAANPKPFKRLPSSATPTLTWVAETTEFGSDTR